MADSSDSESSDSDSDSGSSDDDDKKKKKSLIQINPHEKDTDDISLEQSPENFDSHHSKMWNDMVNKKAVELEN